MSSVFSPTDATAITLHPRQGEARIIVSIQSTAQSTAWQDFFGHSAQAQDFVDRMNALIDERFHPDELRGPIQLELFEFRPRRNPFRLSRGARLSYQTRFARYDASTSIDILAGPGIQTPSPNAFYELLSEYYLNRAAVFPSEQRNLDAVFGYFPPSLRPAIDRLYRQTPILPPDQVRIRLHQLADQIHENLTTLTDLTHWLERLPDTSPETLAEEAQMPSGVESPHESLPPAFRSSNTEAVSRAEQLFRTTADLITQALTLALKNEAFFWQDDFGGIARHRTNRVLSASAAASGALVLIDHLNSVHHLPPLVAAAIGAGGLLTGAVRLLQGGQNIYRRSEHLRYLMGELTTRGHWRWHPNGQPMSNENLASGVFVHDPYLVTCRQALRRANGGRALPANFGSVD